MSNAVAFSSRERLWLSTVAAAGLVVLNGVFIYALVLRPEWLSDAQTNPVSLAFMVEALVMTGVLAYLLRKWRVSDVSWGWFVVLALLGGLAFAVPVAALWRSKRAR